MRINGLKVTAAASQNYVRTVVRSDRQLFANMRRYLGGVLPSHTIHEPHLRGKAPIRRGGANMLNVDNPLVSVSLS